MKRLNYGDILKRASQKKEETTVEPIVDVTGEETKESAPSVTTGDIKAAAESIAEKKTAETESVKTEEPVIEDKAVETEPVKAVKETDETTEDKPVQEAVESKEETVAEEPVVEEAPAPKKTRKKKSAIDYREFITSVCAPCMNDKEWEENVEYIKAEINKIVLPSTTTPATIAVIVERIDALYDIVAQQYHEQQSSLTNLTDKRTGLMSHIALGIKGANQAERDRLAVEACENYKRDGKTYNLYEIVAETNTRLAFLKGVYERLTSKRGLLITLMGALKLSD